VDDLAGDEDRNLVVEDHGMDDIDIGAVVNACSTPPFLASRRVVVVRDAGRLTAAQAAALVAYLSDSLPSTALVLVAGGGTIPATLLSTVRRVGEVVDSAAGTGRSRARWLTERLASGPVRLDAASARRIGDHVGEDLGALSGLLDVLAAAYGEGAEVAPADLEPFLGEAGSVAPWELTDAIDRGDTAVALELLRRLTGPGQRHPLVVLSVLHRHYAATLRLDGSGASNENEAAEVLGARSPFVAGKALSEARRLGSQGVCRAVRLLADADLDLRGETALSQDLVLEVLVARLSRLGPRRASRRPTTSRGARSPA
jgi:DNA polymerase III subunit delta